MANIVMAYGQWPGTTGAYFASAFRGLGHSVTILPLESFRRARLNQALGLMKRSLPYISYVDARRWMRARKLSPDLFLWVESPRFVDLALKKPFPCPSAAMVIDTHTKGDRLRQLSHGYDRVFVAQKEDADAFAREGFPASWLPLAADPEVHRPFAVRKEFDVGFVGNIESARYEERFRLLRGLSAKYKVHIARAYGQEMAKEYSRCRVGFNKSLKGDLNMRVFEVMAMGVPLVTDRIENGQGDLFNEGTHFLGYTEAAELEAAVDSLLHGERSAQSIASRARAEVLEKHLYIHRAKTILDGTLR